MTEPIPINPAVLMPPNTQVVAEAWLAQRVPELNDAMVGGTLPKDTSKWALAGFLQARAIMGGTINVDTGARRPVIQIDAWGVTPGSNKPPWSLANRLIECVVRCTEQDAQAYGHPVVLDARYGGARVQAAWMLNDPRQIFGDPSGYARFTADLVLDWVRL